MKRVLYFDVETCSADQIWSMRPQEFVRLCGYTWNDDQDVRITTSLEEMRDQIGFADLVVGHNIHAFDLTALYGKDSIDPLRMARAEKILDTWVHASLVNPAPTIYVDRFGKNRFVKGPEQAKSWYGLDEQAHQLGVPGKSTELSALAKEFGGYDLIPTDNERYIDYLRHDVLATRHVAKALLKMGSFDHYAKREQAIAAVAAQISKNGWRVDVNEAKRRIAELNEIRDGYMEMLVRDFGMPVEGKAPLRTDKGKEAVLAALKTVGIRPNDLPRTPKGAISLGGKTILTAAEGKGEQAEGLAKAIAEIGGMRPLAESALKHMQPDGKVHPQITMLQRSGRWSIQDPGLTIWTSRGEGAVEKKYFIPNADNEHLVSFDFSQADARIVAAYSGDTEFAKRFDPGADAHMLTAYAVWGRDVVDSDPVRYRQIAKNCGHAYAYRAGAKKIAQTAEGVDLQIAKDFVAAMQTAYPGVTRWQDRVTREGRGGYVVNDWGRKMIVEQGREWTQAPALLGQSGTRELLCDGLLNLHDNILRMVVAQIHDEIVLSIPDAVLERTINTVKDTLECDWKPRSGGQSIHFPVGNSKPALNWMDCDHG